ncbi:hypothetical protein GCM10022197_40540 [Microlunatus spumicola]|uniref:SPFH domain / Band 7 family protein n=1 Tax=Microlunatus spumicola TaxID=81499 RepID=A0ABP6Y894_9ACTN
MVAPVVEALLLHVMRRRAAVAAKPVPRPTRLVSRSRTVSSVGYVAERTSVLLLPPGGDLQVLPAGSLVLPALLGRHGSTYVVVSHDPVDVWLRVGPFETLDDRQVHQVELRLRVTLGSSPSGLRELTDGALPDVADPEDGSEDGGSAAGAVPHRPGRLDGVGEAVLDRLASAVSDRTTEAVRRRTLAELTGLSLAVVLDGALPPTFLGGLVERTELEVLDVDWPTEGRGLPVLVPPAPGAAPDPGPVPR